MGNRGILHDDTKTILRTHKHQNWVTCELSFKDRKRKIMSPGRYTELFFLDETTAFAAGHRPCAECRRARYREFTDVWRTVHGGPEGKNTLPGTIDKKLHATRIDRSRQKITSDAPANTLPDGAMFMDGSDILLVWQRRHLKWNFDGYQACENLVSRNVKVLTPQPLIEVFRNGFTPTVHHSAG